MEITADFSRSRDTSRNALIEQNTRLVPYALNPLLARYPNLNEADRQDVLSAGYLSLCRAADLYEPNANAAFSTFAHHVIVWAGRTALARHIGNPKARKHGFSVVSLETLVSLGASPENFVPLSDLLADHATPEPFTVLLRKDGETRTREALWEWARRHLTKPQAQAVWLYYGEAKTSAEIAGLLGTSRQDVTNLLKNALARLQRAGFKNAAAGRWPHGFAAETR